jgi:hypothetical protein
MSDFDKNARQSFRRICGRDDGKCLHYYFYFMDEKLGFLHPNASPEACAVIETALAKKRRSIMEAARMVRIRKAASVNPCSSLRVAHSDLFPVRLYLRRGCSDRRRAHGFLP